MCIVCNCGDFGGEFVCAFTAAQSYMKAAADAMLKCSQVAIRLDKQPDYEQRRQYDAAHKQIVRVMREWNKIEHQREHHSAHSA
jgi:hypothetical protein